MITGNLGRTRLSGPDRTVLAASSPKARRGNTAIPFLGPQFLQRTEKCHSDSSAPSVQGDFRMLPMRNLALGLVNMSTQFPVFLGVLI